MIHHLLKTSRKILRRKQSAQGLVEFALAIPILLLLIFGIIEFGRFLQAWLALENGARFGVRYAITGNYNPEYCDEAGIALGLSEADAADGSIDCKVPNTGSYVNTWEDMTSDLEDWARLPSIRDVALSGATGIALDENNAVSGDYIAYLTGAYSSSDFSQDNRGDPSQAGYINVTIC